MNETQTRLHKNFLKKISSKGTATTDTLREALSEVAPYFHISGVEVEIAGIGDTADRREILYQDPDAKKQGDPLQFAFPTKHRNEFVVHIQPADRPFSRDERDELEIYATECFFYNEIIFTNEQAEKSAMTQYLSGLPNAGAYVNQAIRLVMAGVPSDYSAFYFDIRGFSRINRKYGQMQGDGIIRRYGQKLTEFIKYNECVGHLGGDKFVAMIRQERKDAFIAFLSDVVIEIDKDGSPEKLHISATIGEWDIERDEIDPSDIIGRPSLGLSYAKSELGTTVVSVTDAALEKLNQKKTVLGTYRDALENDEFIVYYQPKVDSRGNILVGAEGLVRWMHDGEMVSPGVFIPPLEQNGDILLLDYYVLQRACADIRGWVKAGLEPVVISVNFSRKDLADRHLAENIFNIIEESGIDKSLIEIEVTETVDEEEHGTLTEFINSLCDLGIRTAIDDFGAGYSSLSTLREFRANTLKIDRSFINTDDFSWKDEVILTDIIHMAGELGMDVITEGVEREDQLALVNNAGCHVIQGFFYDRPLPKEEFEKRLMDKQY